MLVGEHCNPIIVRINRSYVCFRAQWNKFLIQLLFAKPLRLHVRGGGDLLRQLHALAEAESELCIHQKCLSEIEAKIKELLPLQKKFKELKSYDLSLFQSRAEQNEHHKLSELVKRIEQELGEAKSSLNEKQHLYENCVTQVSLLEKSIHEHANNREARLKDLEKKIKTVKGQMQSASKDLKGHENEREKLIMEMEAVEQEQASLENQLTYFKKQIVNLTSEVDTNKKKVASLSKDHDQAQSELNVAHLKLRECDAQINFILKEQKKLQHKLVNKKVMAMFEKAEDEFNDLISKKNIIENDKSKITMVIEELDEKKRETLKVTWVKVNNDFGSIFSILLPDTMAKLEPLEGGSFLDGLEVRVAFGGVWKQSLSELSGGQKSLQALSLILALLLFKPAPLYILDEVDAALDLRSHTQNIGRMIKAHFPHFQFIVVSLKEGKFNNTSVLFRTKFVDGVSIVQRTVASKQSK